MQNPRASSASMAGRIDRFDWSSTPLGPKDDWPQSLKTAVELLLATAQPACIGWGSDGISLYNDAYIPILGAKHPHALGLPHREAWPDIAEDVDAVVAATMAGESRSFADPPVPFDAHGARTMGWLAFSWTPIHAEGGAVGGFHCLATERNGNEDALAEELRNTRILQGLATRLVSEDSVQAIHEEILVAAMAITRARAGTVQRFDDETRELVVIATRGFSPETQRYFRRVDAGSNTSCGLAMRTGERSHFDFDPAGEEVSVRLHVGDGVLSAQSTPLVSRVGKAIGMVSTHWSAAGRRLSERESRFLDLLARQAADLLEQRAAEAVLRERDGVQAFLLSFSDELRAEPDPKALASRALARITEKLALDRCYLVSFDFAADRAEFPRQYHRDGLAPLPDGVRLSDFPASVRQVFDRTLVVDDAGTDPMLDALDRQSLASIGQNAFVAASLRHGPRNPVSALVAVSIAPRRWTPNDVALVEEAAERTWIAIGRARAEAALRASEEKYRSLFETMNQGYCELELVRDDDGRAIDQHYLDFNPAFERLFGMPVEQARGRRASEVFPGLDPVWTDMLGRVADSGLPERIEHAFGRDRWFEVIAYPGRNGRMSVLYEDITERKRAELSLRESGERYRNLFETMRQGYIENELIRDAHGHAIDFRTKAVNPQFERLTGIPAGEAVGRTARELVGTLDAAWIETYERVVRTGEPERFEREEPAFGRWFEVQAYPLGGDRFAILYDDITARKRTEDALRESEERFRALFDTVRQRQAGNDAADGARQTPPMQALDDSGR